MMEDPRARTSPPRAPIAVLDTWTPGEATILSMFHEWDIIHEVKKPAPGHRSSSGSFLTLRDELRREMAETSSSEEDQEEEIDQSTFLPKRDHTLCKYRSGRRRVCKSKSALQGQSQNALRRSTTDLDAYVQDKFQGRFRNHSRCSDCSSCYGSVYSLTTDSGVERDVTRVGGECTGCGASGEILKSAHSRNHHRYSSSRRSISTISTATSTASTQSDDYDDWDSNVADSSERLSSITTASALTSSPAPVPSSSSIETPETHRRRRLSPAWPHVLPELEPFTLSLNDDDVKPQLCDINQNTEENNNNESETTITSSTTVTSAPRDLHPVRTIEPEETMRKVLVIGDSGVGKSSFVQRFVCRKYNNGKQYQPTVGVDFALKVLQWSDSVKVKLQMWDIAGQERFTSMTRVYYKDAHACVIMFDLTQRSSFDNAARWKKDLDSKCTLADGSPIPCMLLANKCDLHAQREVDQESIEAFIKEHNFTGWTETSVKSGSMVDESMKFLVDELMTCYGEEEEPVSQRANITLRSEDDIRKKDKSKCSC